MLIQRSLDEYINNPLTPKEIAAYRKILSDANGALKARYKRNMVLALMVAASAGVFLYLFGASMLLSVMVVLIFLGLSSAIFLLASGSGIEKQFTAGLEVAGKDRLDDWVDAPFVEVELTKDKFPEGSPAWRLLSGIASLQRSPVQFERDLIVEMMVD